MAVTIFLPDSPVCPVDNQFGTLALRDTASDIDGFLLGPGNSSGFRVSFTLHLPATI